MVIVIAAIILAVLYFAVVLQRIKFGGEQIAKGDLQHKIDTKYLPDAVVATPDWEAAEGSAGHILHKPTIPDAQVQVDWDIDDVEDSVVYEKRVEKIRRRKPGENEKGYQRFFG